MHVFYFIAVQLKKTLPFLAVWQESLAAPLNPHPETVNGNHIASEKDTAAMLI